MIFRGLFIRSDKNEDKTHSVAIFATVDECTITLRPFVSILSRFRARETVQTKVFKNCAGLWKSDIRSERESAYAHACVCVDERVRKVYYTPG